MRAISRYEKIRRTYTGLMVLLEVVDYVSQGRLSQAIYRRSQIIEFEAQKRNRPQPIKVESERGPLR